MLIWDGTGISGALSSGGRYDPETDSWMGISTVDAPSPRSSHTAVWSGSEMLVWGGTNGGPPVIFNDGGRYDPVSNAWAAIETEGAPFKSFDHTAV